MPRNRVIYQSEGLYVSKEATSTTTGQHYQLDRVQSANYSFNIARQDINQFGELARIDSVILESPTVSLDFSYYLTDGANEKALGFNVTTGSQSAIQFPSGQLTDGSGQNFYIVTTSEGQDLNSSLTSLSGKSVIGIGNAYLTDYTVDLSVGNIPTVSVSMEGANMNAFTIPTTGSDGQAINCPSAAINQSDGTKVSSTFSLIKPNGNTGTNIINALRPGDVTLSFGNIGNSGIGASISGLNVQSASLSLPLGRTPIERLGSKFAYVRTVDFPVVATLTVNGVVSEVGTSGSLVDLIEANPKNDITITVNKPGGGGEAAVKYTLKNAQLDSTSYSSSIGANKTVDLTFTTQIGGSNDTVNGIQMSGSCSGVVVYV